MVSNKLRKITSLLVVIGFLSSEADRAIKQSYTPNRKQILENSYETCLNIQERGQRAQLEYILYNIGKSGFFREEVLKEIFNIPYLFSNIPFLLWRDAKGCYIPILEYVIHRKADHVCHKTIVHELFHHFWFTLLTKKEKEEFSREYTKFLQSESDLLHRIKESHSKLFRFSSEGFALIGMEAFINGNHIIPHNLRESYEKIINFQKEKYEIAKITKSF